MSAAAGLAIGYLADLAFGDPQHGHPVAGFGHLAQHAERRWYEPTRVRGVAVTGALVGSVAAATALVARAARRRGAGHSVAMAATTWAALGGRSLRREAARVGELVSAGQIVDARVQLRSLCGRDAAELDGTGLSRAAVESLAENTSDAVVGALWWGMVAGPAGVAAYRAANTLDAMFGHHSERYERFGWAPARLDDALNWPVARATVALSALLAPAVGGRPGTVWETARRDGPAHPSPNAGRVEAAFAGALGLSLGGPLAYGGRAEQRPWLGDGLAPTAADIARAARLSQLIGAAAVIAGAAVAAAREVTTR